MKTIDIQRIDGPEPRYYRVWIGSYCVADGVGPIHARVLAFLLRRLAR